VAGAVLVFLDERRKREAAESEVEMARMGLLHPLAPQVKDALAKAQRFADQTTAAHSSPKGATS
jgi:hypothetical protein